MLNFLATGDWSESQVAASVTERSSRKIVPEVQDAIARIWTAAQQDPTIHLFDGPTYRLESWRASPDQLNLTLAPSTYRIFYGTNLHNAHLADTYGPEILANPVGVSAALLSSDGFLLLGRRNATVAYYPNRIHPFAGALDPRDTQPGEPPKVFHAVRRELREELHFADTDLTGLRCIGLVEDQQIRQPELIFLARSTKSRAAIQHWVDPTEHRGSVGIFANVESIRDALTSPAAFTPVAVATLILYARHRWGIDIRLPARH
jgi:8-oxo-dGTP pyrophosphatase MutT (NUDIX family)